MKIDTKRIEQLADEANIKGDNNLAIILYTFLGSRKSYMDNKLAEHCQDWARERSKEVSLLIKEAENAKKRRNN